MRSVIAA